MELILSDSFRTTFEANLRVDEEHVLATFKNPDRVQSLENSISLHLKKFDSEKLSYLLLCTQIVRGEALFTFAYWIPEEYVVINFSLIDILEIFANNFGCKVKISEQEGYFIKKARRLINGRLESPYQLMEILSSVHIPCESFVFYNEKPEYRITWVDCYYCFAINNNKYYTWLFDLETGVLNIERKWYNYLSEIKDVLNPYGKTSLTIISKKVEIEAGYSSYRNLNYTEGGEMEFRVPKRNLPSFKHIIKVLSQLGENDKIVVIPQLESTKCVFCNSSEKSKEHIFAQWMRDYFEEKDFTNVLHLETPEDNLLDSLKSGLSKGTESSYGYTTNKVCENCNTGWMSQLEEKVKSIITESPIKLKRGIDELTLDQKNSHLLANWITVKALLLCAKSDLKPAIPREVYPDIMKGKLHSGLLVEMTSIETSDINFSIVKGASGSVNLLRLNSFDSKTAKELTSDFFMVCIQIGHFLFRVSYFDESKGLKRESCLKRTRILHPHNRTLQHKIIDNEQKKWEAVDSKFHLFRYAMSLTDFD